MSFVSAVLVHVADMDVGLEWYQSAFLKRGRRQRGPLVDG